MRWVIARYQPVSLFSLKHGEATSTGGKSLLVPTPFAIRTALLDVAMRVRGREYGQQAFEHIHALRLAVRPPERAAVTNLFAKVLKPERDQDRSRAMQQTIAFREYVYLLGMLELAFGGETNVLEEITPLLPQVTYFGKRGSFFQCVDCTRSIDTEGEEPPNTFLLMKGPTVERGQILNPSPKTFPLGIIQRMDDWGPELTFAKINIYEGEKVRMGSERIRFDMILPYQMRRAGRGFVIYERF